MNKKITLLLALIVFSVQLSAQSARENLDNALRLYEKKDYYSASKILEKSYGRLDPAVNPYASSQLFLLIRCDYQLERYDAGIKRTVEFMERFRDSRYTSQVLYFKAQMLIAMDAYSEAGITVLQALDFADEEFEDKVKDLAREISSHFMDEKDVVTASSFQSRTGNLVFTSLLQAEVCLKRGEKERAEILLRDLRAAEDIRKRYDRLLYNELVRMIRTDTGGKTVTLGVVLPLSGDQAGSGTAILQGLKFAVEQYKKVLKYRIDLVILDNRGELLESVNAAKHLAKMPEVSAIIGPLSSRNAVAMASVCELYGIPLLSPTATIPELSQLGNMIYQFNTSQVERSYALAEFVIDSLEMTTFATMAPSDDYGMACTEGFISAVENKGGEVVYMGWYSGSPDDLKLQYREMRNIAFNILESDTLDTNNVLLDSTLVLKTYSDSMKIRLSTIDAVYTPVYAEHIEYITSQLAWYNFDIQLLGDGAYNNRELLDKYQRYVNGVLFSNNFYIDEEDREYAELSSEFERSSGTPFGMLQVYGYEMVSFLVNASRNKPFTREELPGMMDSVGAYRGLIRNIQFVPGSPRANHGVRIINYRNGKIRVLN